MSNWDNKEWTKFFEEAIPKWSDVSKNSNKPSSQKKFNHVICSGSCGKTVLKLIPGSEARKESISLCKECFETLKNTGKTKLSLPQKIKKFFQKFF